MHVGIDTNMLFEVCLDAPKNVAILEFMGGELEHMDIELEKSQTHACRV